MIASNVRVIEPKVKAEKNDYNIIHSIAKKRVCAYCRVSTDLEEQETSFASQKEYYANMINEHENWTLVEIYADEGITATSMRKRKNFLRMIDDAMAGKIDLILCKSISRFARNTVDCLGVLEKLTQKGIPVIFENEHLNSMDDERTTRLRITIESASAQEYSENLSRSVKWGKQRRVEQGFFSLRDVYGYDCIRSKDKNTPAEYRVNEYEAEIVKYIYNTFLDGYSTYQIANFLNERGVKSPQGKAWHNSQIARMMRNEIYTGTWVYQKTVGTDLKTRRRVENTTEKKYVVDNHHVALIDRATFDRVEKEFEYRTSLRGYTPTGRSNYTSLYPFSARLYCQHCGSRMRRHYYLHNGVKVFTWVCINHKEHGKDACPQFQIKEKSLENAFVRAVNKLIENQDQLVLTVKANIQSVVANRVGEDSLEVIDRKLKSMQAQISALIEQSIADTTGDCFAESQRIMAEMSELKRQKECIIKDRERLGHSKLKLLDLEKYLTKEKVFNEFNDVAFRKMVQKATVKDYEIIFEFNDLVKIIEYLEK